jgi:uncharacterized membrane protein
MEKERKFTTGEALGFGWDTFKENPFELVLLAVIVLGVSVVFSYLRTQIQNSGWGSLVSLVSLVASAIVSIGAIKITLDYVYKRKTSLKLIFTQWKYFWRYLLASIIYGFVVVAGLILLVVPGIIWSIKYGYFGYAIVDKDMGIAQSLSESSRITMGYKGQLFWFKIVLGLVQLLGFIALGVGIFIAYPVVLLAETWVYIKLAQS